MLLIVDAQMILLLEIRSHTVNGKLKIHSVSTMLTVQTDLHALITNVKILVQN